MVKELNMDKLGAAIIGCGWVAEEYVKAFQKDERSEIRALVSRNCANAERYRDRYNLNCAIETDADKVFKRSDVDIVVVCTPHNVHTPYVSPPPRRVSTSSSRSPRP
jgi:predicted dehydrogenase